MKTKKYAEENDAKDDLHIDCYNTTLEYAVRKLVYFSEIFPKIHNEKIMVMK